MEDTQTGNDKQITRSKTLLRGQIRELQAEVVRLKAQNAEQLKTEQARFEKRFAELEEAASNLVGAALALVKVVNG